MSRTTSIVLGVIGGLVLIALACWAASGLVNRVGQLISPAVFVQQPAGIPLTGINPQPAAPAEQPAPADSCGSVPMTDYAPKDSGMYQIDVGGPDQREILNLWIDGSDEPRERTYIVGQMTTLRSQFTAYGNKRIYHTPDCDWHNLLQEAVGYAQRTGESNHTGEIWLVLPNGDTKMLVKDAFSVSEEELATMVDPTQ